MNWLRLYTSVLDNRKLQKLSGEQFKSVVNLWCLASIHNGTLPCVSDVAFRLRCTEDQAADLIDDLIGKGLLDRTPNGVIPHDWDEHQYASDNSTQRVQKYRERKAEKAAKQAETEVKRFSNAVEQNRTDTEQNRTDTETCVRAALPQLRKPNVTDLNGLTSQRFDEFWGRYPRQQHRDAACHQWLSVVTIEVEPALFGCLQRYLDSDEVARGAVQNPEKWLLEQHRDGWAGNWPAARLAAPQRQQTAMEQALAMAKARANGTK